MKYSKEAVLTGLEQTITTLAKTKVLSTPDREYVEGQLRLIIYNLTVSALFNPTYDHHYINRLSKRLPPAAQRELLRIFATIAPETEEEEPEAVDREEQSGTYILKCYSFRGRYVVSCEQAKCSFATNAALVIQLLMEHPDKQFSVSDIAERFGTGLITQKSQKMLVSSAVNVLNRSIKKLLDNQSVTLIHTEKTAEGKLYCLNRAQFEIASEEKPA